MVVNPYNEILLSNKNEWIHDKPNNINLSQNNCAELKKKTDKKEYVLYGFIYIKILQNTTKSRIMI